jgi:hypothetical protein
VVVKRSIFWDIIPGSPLKVNRRFGGTYRLHLQQETIMKQEVRRAMLATCFTLVSYLLYSSTLTMEVTCSSETSVEFQQTTQRYSPEDRTLHCSQLFFKLSPRVRNINI